jgi:hypothetical protein
MQRLAVISYGRAERSRNEAQDTMKVVRSVILLAVGLFLGFAIETRVSFGASAGGLTQTQSGGGVTVKVTYLNPKASDDVRFQVLLDTHSVNLDGYDLKRLSLLRDETGKTYEVARTEGKGSGHHREFILIFPQSSGDAKRLEFVIKDIAGVKERTFRWDLE